MKNRLTSLATAIGLLCLAPVMASASAINFDFTTWGTLSQDGCDSVLSVPCYRIGTTGTANTGDVPGTTSWTFSGYMTFYGSPWFGVTDPSKPSGWSFLDDTAGNNLSGTFGWVFLPADNEDSSPRDMAFYQITGGTGLFAGATGDGSSVISISRWYSGLPAFYEIGTMHVRTPETPVPEPATTSLVAAGLMVMGFVAYRRRRVDLTRK